MALTRIERWGAVNGLPGTQTAGSPEGAVADGQESIEVEVTLTGTPSQLATDYATLVTNVAALTSGRIMTWRKR